MRSTGMDGDMHVLKETPLVVHGGSPTPLGQVCYVACCHSRAQRLFVGCLTPFPASSPYRLGTVGQPGSDLVATSPPEAADRLQF